MSQGNLKPTNVRWVVFGLAFGTSWLLYLHRYAFAIIKPKLREEWGLSNTELGALDSVLSVTYATFQLPLGICADWLGVHLVLTGLILLWSLGFGLHAWAPSPAYLWYARATLGIGQSAVFANLSRMAQSWFPASIRSTLQGIVGITAGRLGGMCANVLIGTVLLGWLALDWRTAVYWLSGIGVLFAIVFAIMFRNSPARHPLVNEGEAALMVDSTSRAVSARLDFRSLRPRAMVNMIMLNIQTILSTLADNIYSNWIPLFLIQVHDLEYKQMGIYSALPLLGGAIAGVVGGMLNDACIAATGNRRWSRTGIAGVGKGLAGLLLLSALLWYENPYVFCIFLFAVKFFGDWSLATSWGVVTDIGGRVTASVFAFNNAVAGVAFIIAPLMFGYLADELGWTSVFIAVAATYLLCALSWLAIDCTIPMVAEQKHARADASS